MNKTFDTSKVAIFIRNESPLTFLPPLSISVHEYFDHKSPALTYNTQWECKKENLWSGKCYIWAPQVT